MEREPEWLPELEGTVPEEAYGYAISIYSIAYEAWRRGLDITFENIYHHKGKFVPRYSISSPERRIKFSHTRPDVVDKEAINICSNKQLTREKLASQNVPVPKGLLLNSLDPKKVRNEISDLQYPLVVKPLAGHGGRGVITGIDNFKELMDNIEFLRDKLKYDEIIVEEYIEGEDYRAFVIGDKVVGAFRRLPPHVIGDGKKTIRELLHNKNEIRIKIPGTYNLRIRINEEMRRELKKQKLTLKSVPKEDQFVRLKTKNNVSSGGDPIDATHELTEDLKENLVRAVKAIPGLIQGGVDVMYDKSSGRYAILEINTKPSIRNHLFPLQGKAHEIPKALIDYYFPETKGKYLSDTTPKYYFDYSVVKEHIQNNRLKNLALPNHPYEPNLISKKITFKSENDIKNIKQMLRRNFHKLKFNGEMTPIDINKYELTIAGNYQDIAYFIDVLKSKRFITDVKHEDYDGGIRLGITLNDELMIDPVAESKKKNDNRTRKSTQSQKSLRKVRMLEREVSKLEEEIDALKTSKSWKITSPMRKLRKKIGR